MIRKHIKIEKLGINGEGVTYIDGKVCFVKGALPEDVIEVKIKKDKKKYMEGELVNIETPSPHSGMQRQCGR